MTLQKAQLSLTNRAMLVCKVVEVWQDFLSEYADKKFSYICYRRLDMNKSTVLWQQKLCNLQVIKLCNLQQLKIAVFTYSSPHFCFPWGNHAKCYMYGKRIRCLHIVSQHIPIYLQQFPSYSNRKCKKSPSSRTAAHIFVSPGDAPATITQYVAWMESQFNACQTPCSMYLSIFNSFWVIRCLSQCVSQKIAIFTTFCFPWGRPWSNHAKCCMDGKRIRCLQIVSLHMPI